MRKNGDKMIGLHKKRLCGKGLRAAVMLTLLFAVMLLSSVTIYAGWDGYVEEASAGGKIYSLLNFNSAADMLKAGGIPDSKHTVNGNTYSLGWTDLNSVTTITCSSVPKDWSEYERIDMWVYADGAKGDQFLIYADSGYDENNLWCYYRYTTTVDWEGWKKISILLDKMTITKNPSWKNINKVVLKSSGWDMNPNGCKGSIYIGDLYITSGDGTSLSMLYDEETIKEAKAAVKTGAAVYAGSSNVVVADGVVKKIDENDENVIARKSGGEVLLPLCFFKNYMNAEVKESETEYSIKIKNTELTGEVDSAYYYLNQNKNRFEAAAQHCDGRVYIPVSAAADAFGWYCVSDGKMAAVSPDVSVLALKNDYGVNELSEIISYLAAHEDINGLLTADDCTAVKDRWRRELVGSEADNDINNEDIARKIEKINSTGKSTWSLMVKTDTQLFSNDKAAASADMTATYTRLYNMALAYGTYGGELYHNEDLKNDILYGLEWLNKNRYGLTSSKANVWTAPSDNWWDWKIGTPRRLIPILLIFENELTQKQIQTYLAIFDKMVPVPYDTGSNALNTAKLAIGSALLQNNPNKVIKIQNLVESTYLFVDNNRNASEVTYAPEKSKGQGFYRDGSYVFHYLSPMNGTYGAEQFELIGPFLSMFAGTKFEITTPQAKNIASWIYDAFDPLMYQGSMFRMVMGRYPENVRSSGTNIIGGMIDSLDFLDTDDKMKVEGIIKSRVSEDIGVDYYSELSLMQAIRLGKLMADENIRAGEPLITNHVYYNEDKVVHQRDKFAAGISMSSSRIFNYESINGCNLKGWYVSDGMTEVRIRDNPKQSEAIYWNNIDPYRLPGTTVDTQERKAASVATMYAYLSSKDFVGAVNLDNTYGTAAMWLESYHNDKDFGVYGTTSNVPNPAHDCNLTAKKAWFMFDDEIVCLGSDVNASNDAEVLTIVDNKLASETIKLSAAEASEPYDILSVNASAVPQEENTPENTIDVDYNTKWAAELNASITWDLGEVKDLGFIELAFQNGSVRTQKFTLETSSDGKNWTQTFSGSSSGKTELEEAFTLDNTIGRYVRFTNMGNSNNTSWVSLTECAVYPPNDDGLIGIAEADMIGADKFVADNKVISLNAADTDLTGTEWAYYENVGGYYFPTGGKLYARYTNKANSFMELWFSHGVNPENESYVYALLPAMTEAQTKAYAQNPDIEILSNTADLQVVRDKKLNVTGMVFWKAGSFGDITVDKPMIVMMQENNGELRISACDPTQKLSAANITVNKALAEVKKDKCMTIDCGTTTRISMDMNNSCGRTMEAVLFNAADT